MKHIYYKNDFAVEITLLNASGEVVAPPDWQWHIEFTDGRRKYICSVDNGNANVVGNTIMCYLDNHKFCCGEICYKFVQAIPDLNYLGGFQNLITPKALPIELWEQESDNDVNIQSSVVPAYVVYDAYMTANANGYTGTAEEFYDALNHIIDINKKEAERVEAEANRVTAEQQRVENFVAMESALTTATSKANTATSKAEEASKRADNSATAASQATTQATTATKRANDISADLEAKREADYWRGEKGDKGDKGEKGDQGERGLQGVQGVKGDDGVSPTVTTSKTGKVTTIEITDANGVHTSTVNDGDSVEVVQSTGTSTTAVMSQKAVSDRLSEVDGKMSEISKEQLDDNIESIDFTSDEWEYVAHVDSEGVHAKDFFIQDTKSGKSVSVNASLENKFDEENTPIVKDSSSIHEEKIEITTDDGIPVAGANKSGLYATNYFQLVDGRKIPFALSLESQRQLAFEPNYTSVKYGRLNGGTDNHGTKWYKRFSILHISDTHQYNKEYAEAVSIASGKVDIICNTGDDGNGNVSQSETVSISDLNKGVDVVKNNNSDNLPYLYVKGNHDVCNLKRSSYRNIIGSLIDNYSSNVVWGGADVGYGYIDMTPNSDIGTVRIIMLDQFDYPDADFPNVRGFMSCTYSQSQITWFINVIKDATSKGIKVMTMAHYAFANTTNLWSEEIANADVNGQYQDAFIIPDIIDAVQHGTSINMTYNDSKNKENIIVNEDFSTTARLHYICHLFGHIHSKNWYQCKKADGSKEYDMLMIGETSVGRLGTALNKSYREGINSTACSILEIDTIEQCVYRVNYGAYMAYDATESKVIEKLKYRFL